MTSGDDGIATRNSVYNQQSTATAEPADERQKRLNQSLPQLHADQGFKVWTEAPTRPIKHDPYCDCGICAYCNGQEDKYGNPSRADLSSMLAVPAQPVGERAHAHSPLPWYVKDGKGVMLG